MPLVLSVLSCLCKLLALAKSLINLEMLLERQVASARIGAIKTLAKGVRSVVLLWAVVSQTTIFISIKVRIFITWVNIAP